jgi:hypothetical protein
MAVEPKKEIHFVLNAVYLALQTVHTLSDHLAQQLKTFVLSLVTSVTFSLGDLGRLKPFYPPVYA